MKEKIDHWLDSFEKYRQQYIIMPTESYNSSVPKEIRYITARTPPYFINQENKKDVISMQPYYCYTAVLFLDN